MFKNSPLLIYHEYRIYQASFHSPQKQSCTCMHPQLKKYHVFNTDHSFTLTMKKCYWLESVHHHCQSKKKKEEQNNPQKKATSNHFIMATKNDKCIEWMWEGYNWEKVQFIKFFLFFFILKSIRQSLAAVKKYCQNVVQSKKHV
jgi:hypothetical protein